MSLAKRIEVVGKDGVKGYKYVPVEGTVKAVGVWDTVGSLGIPRMPFHSGGRKEEEVTRRNLLTFNPLANRFLPLVDSM